jgi:hypothetical protein
MKLRAIYVIKEGFNPFVPMLHDYLRQFRYAHTPEELPDDVDISKMEEFAKEMTPEGFRFLRLERTYGK